MKKLLYVILAIIALLIAAVFLTPQFIDANKYKSEAEAQFKAATGYDMAIKGEVKLSFFPKIQARIKNVSIFNGLKNLANIDEITAYPRAKTLFKDKIVINSLKADKVTVTLEKNEAGNNWEVSSTPAAIPVSELDLQVTSVDIVDGKVDYADSVKKEAYSFSDLNFKTGITSLKGPVSFDGRLKYKDLIASAKGQLGNFDAPKISVTTNLLNSEIFYDGTLEGGKFSVKSADIEPLANFLNLQRWSKQLAKQPVDVAGEINYNAEKIDLRNLIMTVGNTSGAGDVSSTTGDKLDVVAHLKFKALNLDQLLPMGNSAPADSVHKKEEEESTGRLREISAELDISADSVTYGGVDYKNLNIKSTSDDGVISLQPFSIEFPKSGRAEMFGVLSDDSEGRVFEGHITAESENLSDILKSFKLKLPPVKPGALEKFKLDSEIVVNLRDNPSADLSDASLNVDDTLFKGNISLDFTNITGVSLNGTVSGLDLDQYIIPDTTPTPKYESGPTDDKPFRITWLEKLPFKGSMNILISKFTYDRQPYENLRLRANYRPETLDIDEISLSGKKIQLSAKGSLYAYPGKKPKANIQANLGKIILSDFIKVDEQQTPRPQDKTRWAKDPFNLSFLRKVDIDFAGNISSFIHNKFVFDNMVVQGYIENGKLVVEKATGTMFAGKIDIKGMVEATAVPSLALAFSGTGVDSARLFDALADNKRVSGKINFSGSAGTSGIYQLAMISNIKGNVSLVSNNLVIKGFDLDGMGSQLTNTNNVADVVSIARTVSGDDAVTYLKNVNGTVVFENGTIRHQGKGIEIAAAAGQGLYSGKADLVNWTMDTSAAFKIITPDRKQKPELGIHIYGPIDDPEKDINLDAIKRYVSGRGAKLLLNGSGVNRQPTP